MSSRCERFVPNKSANCTFKPDGRTRALLTVSSLWKNSCLTQACLGLNKTAASGNGTKTMVQRHSVHTRRGKHHISSAAWFSLGLSFRLGRSKQPVSAKVDFDKRPDSIFIKMTEPHSSCVLPLTHSCLCSTTSSSAAPNCRTTYLPKAANPPTGGP